MIFFSRKHTKDMCHIKRHQWSIWCMHYSSSRPYPCLVVVCCRLRVLILACAWTAKRIYYFLIRVDAIQCIITQTTLILILIYCYAFATFFFSNTGARPATGDADLDLGASPAARSSLWFESKDGL